MKYWSVAGQAGTLKEYISLREKKVPGIDIYL
jgi:hypothetical protein